MTPDAARRRATGPLAGVLGLFFLPSLLCRRPSAVSMTLSPSGGKEVSRAARGQEMHPGHLARAPIASQKTLGDSLWLLYFFFALFFGFFTSGALALGALRVRSPRGYHGRATGATSSFLFCRALSPDGAPKTDLFFCRLFYFYFIHADQQKKGEVPVLGARWAPSLSQKGEMPVVLCRGGSAAATLQGRGHPDGGRGGRERGRLIDASGRCVARRRLHRARTARRRAALGAARIGVVGALRDLKGHRQQSRRNISCPVAVTLRRV